MIDFLDDFEETTPAKPPVAPVASSQPEPVSSAEKPKPATSTSPAPGPSKTSTEKDATPLGPKPATAKTPTNGELDDLEADFSSKFNLGMDSLLKDIEGDPEVQQQLQKMMAEFAGALSEESSTAAPQEPAPASTSKTTGKPSFQDTISQTMNRLNESKQEIDESVKNSENDDFMAKMLKELEAATAGDLSSGEDGDIMKMLQDVLDSMASKEILYDPMKELDDNYPAWIKDNVGKVSTEEMARYSEQYRVVREIVAKFDSPGYSDDNPADKAYITERMQIMQNSGNPPPDLMSDLQSSILPNLEEGLDGLADGDNCNPQ